MIKRFFRITLMIWFICSLSNKLFAQFKEIKEVDSYYLGKKRATGITIHLYPTTFPTRFSEERLEGGKVSISLSPEIYYVKSTNNTTSIQFSYSRLRLYGFSENLQITSTDRSEIWTGMSGNLSYNKNSLGFHVNKHFADRGNLAPIGNHFKYGIRMNMFRNQFNGMSLPSTDENGSSFDLKEVEQRLLYLSLDLGYTYRTMITEDFYFDMTVFGGFPVRLTPNLYNEENREERFDFELFEINRRRLQFANIGSFGFGIGKVF